MEYEIHITEQFEKWHNGIKDKVVISRLVARFARIQEGNFGDSKPLSEDLFELRFTFGGGIRIYYTIQNKQIILLLCAGNKSTQSRDIKKAKQILEELR